MPGEDSTLDRFVDTESDDAESSSDSSPDSTVEGDAEVEADAETEAERDAGPESADAVDATDAADPETEPDVEPAESTYAWSPDGGECASCGESVDRRWRDDGDLVCADCKEW